MKTTNLIISALKPLRRYGNELGADKVTEHFALFFAFCLCSTFINI